MTLGPGGVGGAITGDNIGVKHMFTVKTLAYQLRPAPPEAMGPGARAGAAPARPAPPDLIEQIVQRVLADLRV